MRKRKLIAILVLFVFILSITATAAFAKKTQSQININVSDNGSVQVTMTFKDMHEAQWALKHILKMKAKNIIMGYEDGSFKPNKPVTRAEAVVLTMRAAGLQTEIDNTVANSVYLPFKDFKSIPLWSQKAVALAVQKGYLGPETSGNFQPNKAASREWVVKLVAKALNLQPMNTQLLFKDADKIAADTVGYVAAAVYNQLISGFPNGNFHPNKPITRAEIAVMLGLSTDEIPIPGKIKCKLEGTVVSVSTQVYAEVYSEVYSQGTITLKIDDDGKDPAFQITYPVSQKALIYIDDKAAALGDISVGAKAEAVVKNGMIIYLEVKSVTVKGVVQSVVPGEKKITINEIRCKKHQPAETASYTVTDNAVININGVAADLTKLLPGDIVKLTLNAEGKVTFIKATRFFKYIDILKDKIDKEKDKAKDKNLKDKDKDKDKDKEEDRHKQKEH